jgi:hypothetical protein
MEQLSHNQKVILSSYLLGELRSRGIKANEFCRVSGLDSSYVSHLRKEDNWYRISGSVWDWLNNVHHKGLFDEVLEGRYEFVSVHPGRVAGEVERGVRRKVSNEVGDASDGLEGFKDKCSNAVIAGVVTTGKEVIKSINKPLSTGELIDALIKAGAKLEIHLTIGG